MKELEQAETRPELLWPERRGEIRALSIGELPLVKHPDDLPIEFGNLSVMRLEPKRIFSGWLMAAMLDQLRAPPWAMVYDVVPHGTQGEQRLLIAEAWPEIVLMMGFWPRYQETLTSPTVLGACSNLGRPLYDPCKKERESLFFLDLDAPVSEEHLSSIEKALITHKFSGAIICSGVSYHFVGFFTVETPSLHRFDGRLAQILTPPEASAANLIYRIGGLLERAETYQEARAIAQAVLNPESDLHIPSESTGFYTGSNADIRYMCHRILEDGLGEGGMGTLRISAKPGRPVPYVVSLIHPTQ